MVAKGEFRDELLARFGDYVLRLSPLRQRRDEILPLAQLFLERESGLIGRVAPSLDSQVEALLRSAPWRYNVRGLRNVCRYLVGNAGTIALPADLPPSFLASVGREAATADEPLLHRARRVLLECGGVKSAAARRLGISRGHLYRVLSVDE